MKEFDTARGIDPIKATTALFLMDPKDMDPGSGLQEWSEYDPDNELLLMFLVSQRNMHPIWALYGKPRIHSLYTILSPSSTWPILSIDCSCSSSRILC